MSEFAISKDAKPRLRPGCRLSDAPGQESTLLVPEGILKLTGSGRRIVELCDGDRTLSEIVAQLHIDFPDGDKAQIERDTEGYLLRLRDRNVVEF